MDRALFSDRFLITHTVGPGHTGTRLDAFLKEHYRRKSRESLKREIDLGRISLRRTQSPHLTLGKLKPSSLLIAGDEVEILVDRKPEPQVSFDYRVLFEDDHLLVIDKPANLPVHPAGSYFFHTLLVHLRTAGFTTPLRAEREYFLAHRIDKETSGVLILAKDREICARLTEQFRKRSTWKRYLAVVHGNPRSEHGDTFTIDRPIGKDVTSRIRLKMAIVPESRGGLAALTECRVLKTVGPYSLVECFPKTGRQHQIRVHLASLGYPLVGDKLYSLTDTEAARFYENRVYPNLIQYGGPSSDRVESTAPRYLWPEIEARLVIPRQALHAASIGFKDPVTGASREFYSELPRDLAKLVEEKKTEEETRRPSHSALELQAPVRSYP